MRAAGLRAFVGKLSMDIDITSPGSRTQTYVEPSAAASLANAHAFLDHCHALVAHLPASQRLVAPVLTPRFVPTCTDELLAGLGALSETLGVKIQSHLAEAKDQVEWVRALRGMEDIDVFDKVCT
jgi:guanine deaminase